MSNTMITRKQYLNNEATHAEYYGQFITDDVKTRVLSLIGLDAIKNSTDEHMNDIPLKQWDMITIPSTTANQLKECGDWLTQAGGVCIAKAAAIQIKEEL